MNSIKLTITFLFALMFIRCSGNPLIHNRLETMSETDKMSLDSSEIILADSIGKNLYKVNLSNSLAFIEGEVFDVLIMYTTSTTCDKDVFIYNNRASHWDQLGFSPGARACGAAFTIQRHLLSTLSLSIDDFLDSEGNVLVTYNSALSRISGRLFGVSQDYF